MLGSDRILAFAITVFGIACLSSFVYQLLGKWRVWEYLQVHADYWLFKVFKKETDLMNRAFSCVFCLTWWLSVIFSLILLVIEGDWLYAIVPLFSSPIAKKLSL